MNKPFLAVLCFSLLLTPVTARAANDNPRKFYTRFDLGMIHLNEAHNRGQTLSIRSDSDMGIRYAAALGFKLPDSNFRVEAEAIYSKNDVTSLKIANNGGLAVAGTAVRSSGYAEAWGLMANVYYDLKDFGPFAGANFYPYLMGGFGGAQINENISVSGGVPLTRDHDKVLALQLGAGFVYDCTDNLALELGYRYLMTQDPGLTDSTGQAYKTEYKSHAASIGLRYLFP